MSAGPNSVGPVGLPLRLVCTITTESSPRQRVSMRAFLSTGTSASVAGRIPNKATPAGAIAGTQSRSALPAANSRTWRTAIARAAAAGGLAEVEIGSQL